MSGSVLGLQLGVHQRRCLVALSLPREDPLWTAEVDARIEPAKFRNERYTREALKKMMKRGLVRNMRPDMIAYIWELTETGRLAAEALSCNRT